MVSRSARPASSRLWGRVAASPRPVALVGVVAAVFGVLSAVLPEALGAGAAWVQVVAIVVALMFLLVSGVATSLAVVAMQASPSSDGPRLRPKDDDADDH